MSDGNNRDGNKNYIEILQHLKADKLEIVEKLSHNKDFQQIKK